MTSLPEHIVAHSNSTACEYQQCAGQTAKTCPSLGAILRLEWAVTVLELKKTIQVKMKHDVKKQKLLFNEKELTVITYYNNIK